MDIDPLTKLAVKHGTDKWGPHFYAPVYHALLSHLRERPVRLLEIGVGGYGAKSVGGASLAMWAEYFSQGHIFGLDISEKRLSLGPRVTLLQGSQDDVAFLARVAAEHGPFDIIIDDGSHVPAHVVTSFEALFAHVVEGGLYVIEDVQTTYWPQYGGSAKSGGGIMALARSILDGLNHAEIKVADPSWRAPAFARQIRSLRAYHNMLAIEKGDNDEPSNAAYRIDNPFAERALKIIEAEMERAPTPHGMANLVDMYSLGGRHAKAHAAADGALARWPDHPAVLCSALAAADRAGDPGRGLRHAEGLLRVEPDNAGLQQRVSALGGKLPPPSQPMRQAPAAATDTAGLLTSASDLHKQGRLAEAEPIYAAILAAEPDNFDALNRLGILNLQRGDHDEAHRLLTAAVARNPRSHAALSNLATVLLAMQRLPEALARCDEALALQPDEPSAHYNRGHVLLQLGRAEEAVESYDRVLSLRPDDAQAVTARGRALLILERPDEAVAAFERITVLSPNDADAWFNHASALAQLGRWEEAVASCRRALAIRPHHAQALGKLQALGRLEEVRSAYDRLLASHPDDAALLNNRGLVLLDLKRPRDALADFDRALAIKPGEVDTWYNSANAAVAAERLEDAIARYDRALAINPGHTLALNNRGNALRSLHRLDDALASYDRAVAVKPDMVDALYNRANVLAALRRHSEAQAAYGRVLEVEPRHFAS
ncbi:MAG TPA: tetratricopeptide repeat protein, partial [Hyphomicrobiaceae bacterium]|nr:tetratricopeptide repeat protein [Hyphomicrobiaceae bacterium]